MDPFALILALWALAKGGSRPASQEPPWPGPTGPAKLPPKAPPGATGPAPKLQPIPAGWVFYQPPPPEVVKRAWALLPTLQLGEVRREADVTPGSHYLEIVYRKEPHPNGKTGVTVYRPAKPDFTTTPATASGTV